jgi:uncharacterized protein (DUF1330 family)
MAAYLIARVKVDDVSLLKDYLAATPPIVKKYHGRFIARGGSTLTLEGPEESRRIVVIEFPTLSDAEAFYRSPEYSQVRKLREGVAVAEFIAVDGVSEASQTEKPSYRRFLVDLRTHPPRSPRLKLGPFILLARCLDKCRAHLAGVAGEYEYDSMIDRWLFAFKGITGDEFKAKVAEGLSDDEMLAWFWKAGKPRTEAEALAWSADVLRYSLSYDPTGDLHATVKRVEYLTAACEKFGLEPLITPVLERLELEDIRSFEKSKTS